MKIRAAMICFASLFLVTVSQHVHAQASAKGSGCDLSYKSIMEQNKVDKIEWVQRWFATYNKPPAKRWITHWKGDPIVSSVLIEHPNFHAAERTTLWLVRTKSRAFYWESVQADWHSVEEIEKRTQRKEIKPEIYDRFLETVSAWKQAEVLKPKLAVDGFSPEFWGFLTILANGPCRQMLLGLDDFMICPTKECKPGPESLGRLMKALSPIF